jgi:hypothetical protein
MMTPADLRLPAGPVTQDLFPGEQGNVTDVKLQGYLDRAYGDSRLTSDPATGRYDRMARALALHFIFFDVFVRMSAQPANLTVAEKGGHGYDMEQIENMRTISDQYLAEFTGLLTPATNANTGTPNRAIPVRFGF